MLLSFYIPPMVISLVASAVILYSFFLMRKNEVSFYLIACTAMSWLLVMIPGTLLKLILLPKDIFQLFVWSFILSFVLGVAALFVFSRSFIHLKVDFRQSARNSFVIWLVGMTTLWAQLAAPIIMTYLPFSV